MASWEVKDAKARFSELLDETLRNGPRVVTRNGVEIAVLVSIEDWRRLQEARRPGLKELLLGAGPRFENLIPQGRGIKRRL